VDIIDFGKTIRFEFIFGYCTVLLVYKYSCSDSLSVELLTVLPEICIRKAIGNSKTWLTHQNVNKKYYIFSQCGKFKRGVPENWICWLLCWSKINTLLTSWSKVNSLLCSIQFLFLLFFWHKSKETSIAKESTNTQSDPGGQPRPGQYNFPGFVKIKCHILIF
jgi:hypothetical protein